MRDGWAPYRRFTQATHQTCLAHLLRRCRLLIGDHPRASLPAAVQTVPRRALALRGRYRAGTIFRHGVAVARGRLIERLGALLGRSSHVADVERFTVHFSVEFPALLAFLFDLTLDATNCRAEQALRPAVATRQMAGGGNRTARGAVTQQVLASVLRTAHQRHLDAGAIVIDLLRTPMPTVPPTLQSPPN